MPTVRKITTSDGLTTTDEGRSANQHMATTEVYSGDRQNTAAPRDLPQGWVWVRVAEIGDVQLGRQRAPKHHSGEHMRSYLRAANVTWAGLDLSDVLEMNFMPKDLETYRLRPDDILLAEASGSANEVGKPALWNDEIADCCFQNTLIRVRSRGPLPKYIYFHFLYDALSGRFGEVAKGIGIHHLGGERLADCSIALAPLTEQYRIVEAIEMQLRRLDAGVVSLKRVQAGLRRYKAAVLKAACEGRLVPQNLSDEPADALLRCILNERREKWETEQIAKMQTQGRMIPDDGWREKYKEPQGPDMEGLPELPQGWAWAYVKQVGDVQLGRQRAPKNHHGPHMRAYIRAANITWNGIDVSDVMEMNFNPSEFETYQLKKGDILLSEASGSPEEVGKPAIWNNEIPDCCFQNTVIRVRTHSDLIAFLYLHFLHDAVSGRFGQIAKGIGIYHLGTDRLSEIVVRIPPLAEQQRIVAEVERRLSVAAEVEAAVAANLKRAGRLRQAILKRAFEGKLVPQDPGDEPASVLLERIRANRAGGSGEERKSGKNGGSRERKREEEQLRMEGME